MTTSAPVAPAEEPLSAAEQATRTRQRRAWYVYDWANSVFSTTVVTVFLGPYLTDIAENAAGPDGELRVFGIPIAAGSYFAYVVSLSAALQFVVLPVVGAIADRYGHKRQLLALFAFFGSAATMALYFVSGERYLLGGALFVLANLAFGCSIVVYNAFLPELSGADERDAVSSRGWATGYLGGALMLAANVALYSMRGDLGLSTGQAVRISLLAAGVWWAVFTIVPVAVLRNRRRLLVGDRAVVTDAEGPAGPSGSALDGSALDGSVLTGGFRQLGRTLRELPGYRQALLFLIAYLLYNDGVQSVITLSASYADKELELSEQVRITTILMVQFVAFGGALLLGRLAGRYGTKRVVLTSLVLWTAVVGLAYFLPARAQLQFYLLGAAIGIVLGGTQALSRSLYSHLIPVGKEAEYFGLYEISEKGTSFIGPLVFGLSLQLTDSYRTAILSLVIFFVAGFVLLARVDLRRGVVEAGNPVPHRI
ncbi:MAG: MFS transporter [Sporichthyaceae bacterium]|nr:MFS transporter [Sporichthyaceae bacterium]